MVTEPPAGTGFSMLTPCTCTMSSRSLLTVSCTVSPTETSSRWSAGCTLPLLTETLITSVPPADPPELLAPAQAVRASSDSTSAAMIRIPVLHRHRDQEDSPTPLRARTFMITAGPRVVVGDTGLEPVTSSVSGKRASQTAPIARAGVVLCSRWRRDLNPCTRLCRPLPRLSATPPSEAGKPRGCLRADDGIRTRDPHLGKVM